jgi:predicted acylesterase/phospholipase RssA
LAAVVSAAGVRAWDPAPSTPPETCLVLSGGGAKGSFEVGFLAYLKGIWDRLNITTVCGTSVGAVNAVPIAESGPSGIDKLVTLWLNLETDADMSEPHPSMLPVQLNLPLLGIDNLEDLFGLEGLDKLGQSLGIDLESFEDPIIMGGVGAGLVVGNVLTGGLLGPLADIAGITLAAMGIAESLDELALLQVKVQALDNVVRALIAAPGVRSFAPLENLIRNSVDPGFLGRPDRPKLRLAMICLEDGDPYYFTEKGTLLRKSANASNSSEHFWSSEMTMEKLQHAIVASSSLPVYFPPVPLTEDHGPSAHRITRHFVDGGIRETLPVRAALDTGCERVIAVLASPLEMEDIRYETSPPAIVEYGLRLPEILANEIVQNDVAEVPEQPESIFTYPTTDVTAPFKIDPGLVRINMDYGYMRGYDATLAIADKSVNAGEAFVLWIAEMEIVRLRKEIWRLEHNVVTQVGYPGAGPYFQSSILDEIRDLKCELLEWTLWRFEASGNDPDSVPVAIQGISGSLTNIHDWWETWERHTPGWLSDKLEQYDLWTPLPVGVYMLNGHLQYVWEYSVPDKPTTDQIPRP